jgi:hypothetical protein
LGTKVVAARPGTVRHVNFGRAFGSKQVLIVAADGTGDFYAHMRMRVAAGTKVKAGDKIGEIGAEGNVTGPHLHFERHRKAGTWSCGNCVDPAPSLKWSPAPAAPKPPPAPPKPTVRLEQLKAGTKDSASVRLLQKALNAHSIPGQDKLPVTGNYGDMTDAAVRACQKAHGFGSDPKGKSSVGPKQATHLFKGMGVTIINRP